MNQVHADGLVLQEWAEADVPVMVALFDTAVAAGFTRTDLPAIRRERKGHVLHLATWTPTL